MLNVVEGITCILFGFEYHLIISFFPKDVLYHDNYIWFIKRLVFAKELRKFPKKPKQISGAFHCLQNNYSFQKQFKHSYCLKIIFQKFQFSRKTWKKIRTPRKVSQKPWLRKKGLLSLLVINGDTVLYHECSKDLDLV